MLVIKFLYRGIQKFPYYNSFRKHTYELYLYSDPINYFLIAMAFVIFDISIYSKNIEYLSLFILRMILTTIGAFIIIKLIGFIKAYIYKYNIFSHGFH